MGASRSGTDFPGAGILGTKNFLGQNSAHRIYIHG